MPYPIGIIAGAGTQPQALIRHLRMKGKKTAAVGFTGLTDPDLESDADVFNELPMGQIERLIAFLAAQNTKSICFAGEFALPSAKDIRPDARAMKLFFRLQGGGRDALIDGVAAELEQEGFYVCSVNDLAPDFAETASVGQDDRA